MWPSICCLKHMWKSFRSIKNSRKKNISEDDKRILFMVLRSPIETTTACGTFSPKTEIFIYLFDLGDFSMRWKVLKINEAPNGYLMAYGRVPPMIATRHCVAREDAQTHTHELATIVCDMGFFRCLFLLLFFFSLFDGVINRSLTQRRTHPGNIACRAFNSISQGKTFDCRPFRLYEMGRCSTSIVHRNLERNTP